MMISYFDPLAWYWIVAGDGTRWWSSAASAYVAPVQAWLDAGNVPTRIGSEAELAAVLAVYNLAPPNPADLSAIDMAAINTALTAPGSIVRALGLLTFQEINKLRVLAGQQAYTMPQFIAALKAQIR